MGQGRDGECMAVGEGAATAAKGMRARLDEGMPTLALLGISCWMAWNSVAFSGAFWLHDIDSSARAESLILVHLVASLASLLLASALAPRVREFLTRPAFVLASGAVSSLGTLLIVVTRASIFPSQPLFVTGCVLSGVGTTGLFLRFAPMAGSLAPRRSFTAIVECSLAASLVFLFMAHLGDEAASCVFIALPLAGSALMCVRGEGAPAEGRALGDVPRDAGGTRGLALFLASVALCSGALELMKATVLTGVTPEQSTSLRLDAELILTLLMAVATIGLHAVEDFDLARLYSGVVAALVAALTLAGTLADRTPVAGLVATCVCTAFNSVVWSMLAYLTYQSQGGALRFFGLGNAALCLGTIVAASFVTAVGEVQQAAWLHVAFAALGIAVLVDALFVFNERKVNELLPPVDDALGEAGETPANGGEASADAHRAGRYVRACEAMAADAGLSAREQEVFLALARGWTAQEIAESKSLSVNTVRAHIRAIYAKTGVHSGKELRDLIRDCQATRQA